MLGILFALCGLVALVLSPFAFFQIITKAGFSGWWTLVPYSPWIIAFLGARVFTTVDTHQSIGSTVDELGLWYVLTLLSGAFVTVMFFIFAFSAWPSLQPPRSRPSGATGMPAGGSGRPSWLPVPAPAGGPSTPDPAQAQPAGWYRTGAVGSGEQGYWDGQAWTARRQWKNGAWVDLPMAPVDPAAPVEAG